RPVQIIPFPPMLQPVPRPPLDPQRIPEPPHRHPKGKHQHHIKHRQQHPRLKVPYLVSKFLPRLPCSLQHPFTLLGCAINDLWWGQSSSRICLTSPTSPAAFLHKLPNTTAGCGLLSPAD